MAAKKPPIVGSKKKARKINVFVDVEDQWCGLLLRSNSGRVFFVPADVLFLHELKDGEKHHPAENPLNFKALSDALDLITAPVGLRNAVLINNIGEDEASMVGMRVTGIIERVSGPADVIGPVDTIWPK